jgi:protein-disulfide isomerase
LAKIPLIPRQAENALPARFLASNIAPTNMVNTPLLKSNPMRHRRISGRGILMNQTRIRRFSALFGLVLVSFAACAQPASQVASPATIVIAPNANPTHDPPQEGAALAVMKGAFTDFPEPGSAVPVTEADPAWGDPFAPVTMVIWADYECPFCYKLMVNTVPMLQQQYGPKNLRIVWRNNPLPFHSNAWTAALAADTVFHLAGAEAFWKYHATLFDHQKTLGTAPHVAWAVDCGVDAREFEVAFRQQKYAANIESDMALGKKVGVVGTPASFINGRYLPGAQPVEKFVAIIDEQLVAARELVKSGVPAKRIYAQLSEQNYKEQPPAPTKPPPDTTTVWRMPIDGSPVRGKKTALVTMVMIADFQCPFCLRSVPVVNALEAKYGDKLRLVFKHNPLPMHPRAEPAAQLAIEAGVQKGEATFWKAFQALFDQAGRLEDQDLTDVAKTLGLDVKRAQKAMNSHAHAERIQRDQDLADDVLASGTPHFFINGRRLVGAQPKEQFEALIDDEIVKSQALVAEGIDADKLYDKLQENAKLGSPPQRLLAPAATRDNPGKGAPLGARVTIQMFADFQCPYCARSQETMDEIVAKFPKDVRIVWRHKPLPFHPFAQMAAEASVEAFKQKGDLGFWRFASRLFEAQKIGGGLDRAVIEQVAGEAGLDVQKLSAALDARTHWKAVVADLELSERLKIGGTPGFVVGDYFISGAQPFAKFKRHIHASLGKQQPIAPDMLLADARQPIPLQTTTPPPFFTPPTPSAPTTSSSVRYGAKHLVVMYAGSMRAPAGVTRTQAEALVRAQEARQKIKSGALFEDIVAQYSDEPGAGARGGDLGTFSRGAMVPQFQSAVENLQVGEVSGVVETPFGYHVIWRTQ